MLTAVEVTAEQALMREHVKPSYNTIQASQRCLALVCLQVALYPLAPLAELQDEAAEPAAALLGCLGSCSSSQRRERMQQSSQQQTVPLLPPVATVRLPGKVSSIAFSPDMQGVISIGDYDGTLTQVRHCSNRMSCPFSGVQPRIALVHPLCILACRN